MDILDIAEEKFSFSIIWSILIPSIHKLRTNSIYFRSGIIDVQLPIWMIQSSYQIKHSLILVRPFHAEKSFLSLGAAPDWSAWLFVVVCERRKSVFCTEFRTTSYVHVCHCFWNHHIFWVSWADVVSEIIHKFQFRSTVKSYTLPRELLVRFIHTPAMLLIEFFTYLRIEIAVGKNIEKAVFRLEKNLKFLLYLICSFRNC